MALQIFNTLTRQKEPFVSLTPRVARIYTCGLTVYAPMHIGHARTYCFWDLMRRYLDYRGYYVLAVINYTDIDDRIMGNADSTVGPLDLAEKMIAVFRRDCRALNIRDYSAYTRATDFAVEQIELARQLQQMGHAYSVDGELFYEVESFPGYGKLSGNSIEQTAAGASGRVEEDFARKRHPADFTLWKPSEGDQPRWETGASDWPQGRPGWHLECSVMSTSLLGEHFDIHGGGIDNLFPHHENELAQSEPVCGAPWVKYWMHPEHLDLRGEKMSKSLGNVVSIPDLLSRHRVEEVRWFFAMNHYRTKVAYSEDLVAEAAVGFQRIARLVRVLEEKLSGRSDIAEGIPVAGRYMSERPAGEQLPRLRHYYTYGRYGELSARFIERFMAALDDDINTPMATAAMFDFVSELYSAGIENLALGESDEQGHSNTASALAAYRCLVRHLWVLGIEFASEELYPQLYVDCFPQGGATADAEAPYKAFIDRLLAARAQARADKDFARADMLRDVLAAAGLVVEDTPQGPRWELAE